MNESYKKYYNVHEKYDENKLIGTKSHKLTIVGLNVEVSAIKRRACVNCECECGNLVCIDYKNFRSGNSKTCGKCNFISFGDFLIDKFGEYAINMYWSSENKISPFEISRCSHKKVLIKCQDKDYHGSYVVSCLDFYNDVRCPRCARKNGKNVHKLDSFAQYHIDNTDVNFLEKYRDYNKNTMNPYEISPFYSGKIWIKCQETDYHDSYSLVCASFTNGIRCSMCSNHTVHKNDSLGELYETVIDIWSDKNNISPFEYSPVSGKSVWWKCENSKHEDYHRKISNSKLHDFRCPKCMQERNESLLQEKVRLYIENAYEVKHEHECTIKPINPKTNNVMPFDNEIVDLKLIIEVHGEQHYRSEKYNTLSSKRNNTTPEYELHKRKLYDRYKFYIAYKNGYEYLEIPYWADNQSEEWKRLINVKIKEINNKGWCNDEV